LALRCERCDSDDIDLVESLDDGRKRVQCLSCGHEWLRGERKRVYRGTEGTDQLKERFTKGLDVSPDVLSSVEQLKKEYLRTHQHPHEPTEEFRREYRLHFSREGLESVPPERLKYFANSSLAANPGNMSVFNAAWNRLGEQEASRLVKESISYLLYGPEDTYLEDRLTNLIEGHRGMGMVGFRESLLTKVLCMVEPSRFIPILKYTGKAGKKEIAEKVYKLRLPAPERSSWTIGRLIIWSNDLLVGLTDKGEFRNLEHLAGFLWGAKDQIAPAYEPGADEVDSVMRFVDDDAAYLEWTRLNPHGFVLNVQRNPEKGDVMLHRADCEHITVPGPQNTTWTGDWIKICALAKPDLTAWAQAEAGDEPISCRSCEP
jgi:hypothetical protein